MAKVLCLLQALVSQRVALELHERLGELQAAGQLPEGQTCDLIILDRRAIIPSNCSACLVSTQVVP